MSRKNPLFISFQTTKFEDKCSKLFVKYSSSFRTDLCVCVLYVCMQQFGSESSKVLMVINEWWVGPINTLFKTGFEDLARVCQFISLLGFNRFFFLKNK